MTKDMNIKEREESIIEDFSLFEDWMMKYEYIIELGKNLPMIDEKFKNESYEVKGCQSKVWLNAEMKDGLSRRYDHVISAAGEIFYRTES